MLDKIKAFCTEYLFEFRSAKRNRYKWGSPSLRLAANPYTDKLERFCKEPKPRWMEITVRSFQEHRSLACYWIMFANVEARDCWLTVSLWWFCFSIIFWNWIPEKYGQPRNQWSKLYGFVFSNARQSDSKNFFFNWQWGATGSEIEQRKAIFGYSRFWFFKELLPFGK